MSKKCLWCLKSETEVSFDKKAHTIPKSLGGQNYNGNVCDSCNEYFGNRNSENSKYSIEEALKETFVISRKRMMLAVTKRKVGRFKSKFFEVKERKGKPRLIVKPSFRFDPEFQKELSRSFKRGLYKMFLEELNRQNEVGYEDQYNVIRRFARYNEGDLPVFYFNRKHGIIMMFAREAETPVLYFDRMKYLYSDDRFVEIEFLGHVFGFPTTQFSQKEFDDYIKKTLPLKTQFFTNVVLVKKLTDIDLSLKILN
jgi:hypothetical protein